MRKLWINTWLLQAHIGSEAPSGPFARVLSLALMICCSVGARIADPAWANHNPTHVILLALRPAATLLALKGAAELALVARVCAERVPLAVRIAAWPSLVFVFLPFA